MIEKGKIKELFLSFFGEAVIDMEELPRSGSDRKYFRVRSSKGSVICTYNANPEENEAFTGFSHHFHQLGLPVPEILAYSPQDHIYFQADLGDTNLYSFLKEKSPGKEFSADSEALYHKIIDNLVLFQVRGIKGLNLDLCYPHRSFDRQSMMWDMNYFKYMFLKLIAAPFNERKLEHDFEALADFLLKAGDDYFLYRDFQSANIMIKDGEPWFIDYQGGRRGAPHYDIASLLYDAKISMPEDLRDSLFIYHRKKFCIVTGTDEKQFSEYSYGFGMIRLMQALGAFGFRGLYENKPTFTESMVPGLKLLKDVAGRAAGSIHLPELSHVIDRAGETIKIRELSKL